MPDEACKYYQLSNIEKTKLCVINVTFVYISACHTSCKSTCWEGGPKGCDECTTGWVQTEEEGCKGIIIYNNH